MSKWIKDIMGTEKAMVGLCHFKALPGDPKYDKAGGMEKIIDAARKDLLALQEGGIDSVLFANEFSIPYMLQVNAETIAAMARIIGELKSEIKIPFGVGVISDAKASITLAAVTGAKFIRGTFSGVYASNFGLMNPNGGEIVRHQHNLGADDVKLVYSVVPESSKCIGGRDPVESIKSVAFLNKPDGLSVAGPNAGVKSDTDLMKRVREAIPDAIIFANTGVNIDTAEEILKLADGAFVGTHLKKDGVFENPVDADRVKRFMEKVRLIRGE